MVCGWATHCGLLYSKFGPQALAVELWVMAVGDGVFVAGRCEKVQPSVESWQDSVWVSDDMPFVAGQQMPQASAVPRWR